MIVRSTPLILNLQRMWVYDVQAGTILVVSSNQQRHTKWSRHDALLTLGTLTESQRQIAYRLRAALDAQRLVVVESVVLALDPCVFDHASCVGLQARHGASDVAVDLDDLLNRAGLKESGGYALLHTEDHTLARCDLYHL
jgi:hypothetical protein